MSVASILKSYKLRKTPVREKVLHIFQSSKKALSHDDIEGHFQKLDRITLYRTLKTFEERGIIHKIPNASPTPLYAICQDECTIHSHLDNHGHFHCEECNQTICMENLDIPNLDLPSGYTISQKHLMIEGKCAKCSNSESQ